MRQSKSNLFWPSFADLMTSLFFIMLVLYVLTYIALKNQQKATEAQLKKIQEIQSAVKELPPDYFAYDSAFKRFSLKRNIEFETYEDVFKSPEDTTYLIQVGASIEQLIDRLKVKYQGLDIKYVVVIEGMASLDGYADNFPLSYKRAWAVLKLWQRNNITLDQSVCEVQVSGSGTSGIGRFSAGDERKNQRILIQVVPKIGEIKLE